MPCRFEKGLLRPRLCSEMDDDARALDHEQSIPVGRHGHIRGNQADLGWKPPTCPASARVDLRVERVDDDDPLSALYQARGERSADEPSTASDQDPLGTCTLAHRVARGARKNARDRFGTGLAHRGRG